MSATEAHEHAPFIDYESLLAPGGAETGVGPPRTRRTVLSRCASCGAAGPVGAAHVYRGAGIVLRCSHCDNVLAKIVKSDSRVWIDSRGLRTLEIAA